MTANGWAVSKVLSGAEAHEGMKDRGADVLLGTEDTIGCERGGLGRVDLGVPLHCPPVTCVFLIWTV